MQSASGPLAAVRALLAVGELLMGTASVGVRWRRVGDVIARRVADEVVILRLAKKPEDARFLYSLRSSGVDIWELLESPNAIDSVSREVARRYDAPLVKVRKDVASFVRKLVAERLVERA